MYSLTWSWCKFFDKWSSQKCACRRATALFRHKQKGRNTGQSFRSQIHRWWNEFQTAFWTAKSVSWISLGSNYFVPNCIPQTRIFCKCHLNTFVIQDPDPFHVKLSISTAQGPNLSQQSTSVEQLRLIYMLIYKPYHRPFCHFLMSSLTSILASALPLQTACLWGRSAQTVLSFQRQTENFTFWSEETWQLHSKFVSALWKLWHIVNFLDADTFVVNAKGKNRHVTTWKSLRSPRCLVWKKESTEEPLLWRCVPLTLMLAVYVPMVSPSYMLFCTTLSLMPMSSKLQYTLLLSSAGFECTEHSIVKLAAHSKADTFLTHRNFGASEEHRKRCQKTCCEKTQKSEVVNANCTSWCEDWQLLRRNCLLWELALCMKDVSANFSLVAVFWLHDQNGYCLLKILLPFIFNMLFLKLPRRKIQWMKLNVHLWWLWKWKVWCFEMFPRGM